MCFSSHREVQTWLLRISLVTLMGVLVVAAACQVYATRAASRASAAGGFYQQTNLVSDLKTSLAGFVDPNLQNPWGLAHSPTGPWWVANNNSHVVTLYRGDGSAFSADIPLVVNIPSPTDPNGGGFPTGAVFNPDANTRQASFPVSSNRKTGSSMFLFATEDGTIAGWNPLVDLTRAILVVNRSAGSAGAKAGAVYKGLALASDNRGAFLYATNFRAGTIEMFNSRFQLIRSFTDKALAAQCQPKMSCFAPFGIQNIGGRLIVTFALQDEAKHDDVKGPGNGFVDIFDTQGKLLERFASHGTLNSPWGLALAPANFGRFSNDLLVSNFGDGLINAFDLHTGLLAGQLSDRAGKLLQIPGLWSLAFGNGRLAGKTNELFFTAGINDEKDGLFGKIQAVPAPTHP